MKYLIPLLLILAFILLQGFAYAGDGCNYMSASTELASVGPKPYVAPAPLPTACDPTALPGACVAAEQRNCERRHPILKLIKRTGKLAVKTVNSVRPLKRIAARRCSRC